MKKEYLEAGKIVGTHGIRGTLRLNPWADSSDSVCSYKRFFIDSDKKELAKQNVYYIFKCIPNMHRSGNPTSRKKRLDFFNGIMHNKEVNAWVSKDTSGDMLIKIFRHLYKIKSPIICDAVYCFLFWIKRNLLNN